MPFEVIQVPIENKPLCGLLLVLTYILSRTVSKLLQIIGGEMPAHRQQPWAQLSSSFCQRQLVRRPKDQYLIER